MLCYQLEELFILGNSSLLAKQNEDENLLFNIDTFLPALASFQSDICLGEWSFILEKKSSLVYLYLSCCHIGMTVSSSREKRSNEPSQKCLKRSVTDVSLIIYFFLIISLHVNENNIFLNPWISWNGAKSLNCGPCYEPYKSGCVTGWTCPALQTSSPSFVCWQNCCCQQSCSRMKEFYPSPSKINS